jgi:hypothetical protein
MFRRIANVRPARKASSCCGVDCPYHDYLCRALFPQRSKYKIQMSTHCSQMSDQRVLLGQFGVDDFEHALRT